MSFTDLPDDLPAPDDDGAADHLVGRSLPDLSLPSTGGKIVALDRLPGTAVFYVYPMTGRPGRALPEGWEQFPGARGCTPQSCAFRDHHAQFEQLRVNVYGISTQDPAEQQEAADRLGLPFPLLSDSEFQLRNTLQLPTFTLEGVDRYKRLTLITNQGKIDHVFYPVFPPNQNAEDVLAYLRGASA